jgi:hypothetical protein
MCAILLSWTIFLKSAPQVACEVAGRTGQQCLHRWTKTLDPEIRRGTSASSLSFYAVHPLRICSFSFTAWLSYLRGYIGWVVFLMRPFTMSERSLDRRGRQAADASGTSVRRFEILDQGSISFFPPSPLLMSLPSLCVSHMRFTLTCCFARSKAMSPAAPMFSVARDLSTCWTRR